MKFPKKLRKSEREFNLIPQLVTRTAIKIDRKVKSHYVIVQMYEFAATKLHRYPALRRAAPLRPHWKR